MAAVFYVYAYGDGVFEVTGNPDTPDSEMVVIDCVGVEHPQLAPAARVGFGAAPGLNPCLADVPVVPTTWSRIKQRDRLRRHAASLLRRQCLDRIEPRRPPRRQDPAEETDRETDGERQQDIRRRRVHGQARDDRWMSPASPTPAIRPVTPPAVETSAASPRKSPRIWRDVAPMALASPISSVRSFTEIHIMGRMPMAPTTNEIAPIPPTAG